MRPQSSLADGSDDLKGGGLRYACLFPVNRHSLQRAMVSTVLIAGFSHAQYLRDHYTSSSWTGTLLPPLPNFLPDQALPFGIFPVGEP